MGGILELEESDVTASCTPHGTVLLERDSDTTTDGIETVELTKDEIRRLAAWLDRREGEPWKR